MITELSRSRTIAFLEMGNIQSCTAAVNSLAKTIHYSTNFTIPCDITGHCFRITLPSGQVVSVSVPPDVNLNLTEKTLESAVFETALFGKDGNIMYSDELGYEDIQRFFSHEDVCEELKRINSLTLRKK